MSGVPRTIKPELLEDAVTARLSDTAFRMFVGAILLADDHGNFRAEPAYLRSQIFWTSEPLDDFASALQSLDTLVVFYRARGQTYGSIKNWAKHQGIASPGARRVPPPDEGERLNVRTPDAPPPTVAPLVLEVPPPKAIKGKSVKRATPNGTRITHAWRPTETTLAMFREEGVDAAACVAEFIDFWIAVPGGRGLKLDWEATFRNRVREAIRRGQAPEWRAPPAPPPRSGVSVVSNLSADGDEIVDLRADPRWSQFVGDGHG